VAATAIAPAATKPIVPKVALDNVTTAAPITTPAAPQVNIVATTAAANTITTPTALISLLKKPVLLGFKSNL
jgi:hypothetical protein